MRLVIFTCFSYMVIMISSCNTKDRELKIEKDENKDLISNQVKAIKDKKIGSLKSILGDSIKTTNHVVFLYNGFDCNTCIDIGYEMSKKMDSISKNQVAYIVSTSANIGRDQLKNEYQKYVFNDIKDLVRKDLKYIYTPVFLLLDSENKISKVFYPNYNRDRRKENLFITECIENFK